MEDSAVKLGLGSETKIDRKKYLKPELHTFGQVKDLTAGGSLDCTEQNPNDF